MRSYNEVPFLFDVANFVVYHAVNQDGEYKCNSKFGENDEILKKPASLRYNSHTIKFTL